MGINNKSFIEVQFPVSKVSKESYKERKAAQSQTLTGLGKWWGRKPLILVRAAILGIIMPASNEPKKDREIFLKLLTMDDSGLELRKEKTIDPATVYDYLTTVERQRYFEDIVGKKRPEYRKGSSAEERSAIQLLVFRRMTYDQKLLYCKRPEEVKSNDFKQWDDINQHLKTNAVCFEELVQQLGQRMFGHEPIIGDCFCGGGSIPFESARMGFDVYASDLNPIALLLTWTALNVLFINKKDKAAIEKYQRSVFEAVKKQIRELGIEENDEGHVANYYLYCSETICPECNWRVPLLSSLAVGKRMDQVVVILKEDDHKAYNFEIKSGVNSIELDKADQSGTIRDNYLHCPHCGSSTPLASIRKDKKKVDDEATKFGLRQWELKEFMPKEDDVFQERLYCIKWEKHIFDHNGTLKTERYYAAPTKRDIENENKIVETLLQKFYKWQNNGIIPNAPIDDGTKTQDPKRERGWAYWHHLFHPRQLLLNGLFVENLINIFPNTYNLAVGALGLNRILNFNSKLCRWNSARDFSADTFYNQALNTMHNYGVRALAKLDEAWYIDITGEEHSHKHSNTMLVDARNIQSICDIWVTDPPYADAVNYHELTEFFLAWNRNIIKKSFKDWYVDSKRALAVKGTGESFNNSMVEIYRNLAEHMPDDGMQVVMFTHQNVSVWADLTMILWASGLRVTAAWNIATETDASGLKQGNYVKGTVLLVLRKQTSDKTAYLDELYPEIEDEVKRQIDSMRNLDDKEDPNFTDADYLLAAYAASLKVLTSYKKIEDIDVAYELSKTRSISNVSPIESIINESVKIAYDYLIPTGFDSYTWKILIPEERFYIKGLDLEKSDIYQVSAYQELARGFGVKEYKGLLASTKANQARLMTASEFGLRGMNDNDRFGSSLLRNILAALHQSIKEEDTIAGRNWLKNEVPNYWTQRNTIVEILDYISTLGHIENMPHWELEANYANMLKERIKDDSI